MTVIKIDYENKETTLTFTAHEHRLLCNALNLYAEKNNLNENDRFLATEMRGVHSLLSDGNFTHLLCYELARHDEEKNIQAHEY